MHLKSALGWQRLEFRVLLAAFKVLLIAMAEDADPTTPVPR